ncbi:MAG: type II toxin-antitoxin system VapC family toxin [Caulobacteraceae bacterium]|nr:type II toxin-antitoxin system VapC family toxin [Caulobacter sp.]
MRLLLDTNALIWLVMGSDELSPEARRSIERDVAGVGISAISLAEIAIKATLGKLILARDFMTCVQGLGFASLPFDASHAGRLLSLPLLHRDPFDRMLVAQALVEGAPLVTRDAALGAYGVDLVLT